MSRGVKKARDLLTQRDRYVNVEKPTHFDTDLDIFFHIDDITELDESDVDLSDLKRLVESLEIIETVGYDRDGAEEIYEFSKDCEVIHYAGLEIKVTRLAQAIRDHESIYGGGE